VYVTNADSANISTFTVEPTTGHPVLTGELVKAGAGVRQMVFTPDARVAYASNSDDGTVSAYTVGPQGLLTRLPGDAGTVATGGDTPLGLAVTPHGHTLYIAHVFSNSLAAFTIASDGSLTPFGTMTTTVTDNEGCSTSMISNGQAVLCNGSAAAATTRDVVVRG
jgi:6-phosphogluconolactonase (cycloisomerase 2 family)